MERYDFLFDENFDLLVENGDFVVGPSDAQHIQLIALSAPLNWIPAPALGPNAYRFLKKPYAVKDDEFEKAIKLHLKMDGYKVKSIDMSQGLADFKVEAELQ